MPILLKHINVGCSVMSDSLQPPWTVPLQAPLSMEFARQEDWSGLPFPSPGYLSDPGIEPTSPALAGEFFTIEPPGKPPTPSRCIEFSIFLATSRPLFSSPQLKAPYHLKLKNFNHVSFNQHSVTYFPFASLYINDSGRRFRV